MPCAPRRDGGAEHLERSHGIIPAEAGVGDALSVSELGGIVLAGGELLRARLQMAFDHDAEDAAIARLDLRRDVARDLDLHGVVRDGAGRAVDGADVEIWQCDAFGSYRHPRGAGDRIDAGFQGFGATRSDARGGYRFRTIRPVPYPGRTPHIHVKLRHAALGEMTSQLFVAGEPRNAADILYRSLADDDRKEVELRLQRAPVGAVVMWIVERDLLVAG